MAGVNVVATVNDKDKSASLLKLFRKRVSRAFKRISPPRRDQLAHPDPAQADPRTPQPYPQLVELMRMFNAEEEAPEILYLGDSVLLRISRDDQDQRKLGEMVEDNLVGKLRAGCIFESAYHVRVYYQLLRAVATMRQRPELVILPINVRCFSPQWDLSPRFQFKQEIQALEQYITNPRRPVGEVDRVCRQMPDYESFDATPVTYPLSPLTHLGHFRLIKQCPPEYTAEQKRFRLQQIFIFHYTHPLLPSHPKLAVLNDILQFLADQGIAVVTYVTPINYQAGESYVGKEFLKIYEANVKIVADLIAPHLATGRASYSDYSTLLGSEYFFNEDNATEHLNQEGRRILSGKITEAVLQLRAASVAGHEAGRVVATL
jgi:hypothetical protein